MSHPRELRDRTAWIDTTSSVENISTLVLVVLGIALLLSNRWFAILDDEANAIVVATAPVRQLLASFASGNFPHAHPPLPDILLHGWLALTGSRFGLLRVPAIASYVAGLALLTATARKLGGRRARGMLLWIAVLWPYGFHFGRIAGWFEFSFLSIALLTYTFVVAVNETRAAPWMWFGLAGLAAIYCNLYAWAVLVLLLVEVAIGWRRSCTRIVLVVVALAISYAPVWWFLVETTRSYAGVSLQQTLLLALYHGYAVVVSESVAPWWLPLGVPAVVAATAVVAILAAYARGVGRRLLVYFVLLLLGMAAANVITTKRLLMVTPWLLLGLAVATASITNRRARTALLLSLGVIAVLGWVGIGARKFYAAPHFIEPWPAVAQEAIPAWRSGAAVISNSGSFMFYFAYAAGLPWTTSNWHEGSDVLSPPVPRVFSPQAWGESGGRPTDRVILVKGVSNPEVRKAMTAAEEELNRRCLVAAVDTLVPDRGYALKQRFFPSSGQLAWRVEVRQYQCEER